MKKSIQNRIRKGLFPEMPQSFADRLTGALKIGGALNADQRSAEEAPTAPVLPERPKRRFPFGKIFNGVAAAVLAALCIVIAVFGIILPNVQKTHGATRPDGYRADFPVGKWTLAEVGQNGEAVDPGEIGLWMELAFSDDGSVTVKTVTGGAEGQYVYRYTFADNAIELTAEGGEIPVLPASGTYDPETDTLRFANEDGARAIFRRKAAASLQARMLGVWSHSYTKYEGIGLTIKKNGAFLTDYTCVSETDTPLIYTVENNVITFTGDGISFTAVYLADEDALSVTWNDKTLQFERSPSLVSPWGTWTMTEMILKDGTRFSADEIGSESTLYFAYLGPLTYTWNVNGNVSQTEYEFWIKGNSIPLRLADGTDVNDPEITYDLETDTLRLFTANDGRTYVYVRMPDLAGKWTLMDMKKISGNGIDAGGDLNEPELIGPEMYLEFDADGTVTVTVLYGDETVRRTFRSIANGTSIDIPDADETVITDTLEYDAATDTLRMYYVSYSGLQADMIFSRTPDAVIPETSASMLGSWYYSTSADVVTELTIEMDGSASFRTYGNIVSNPILLTYTVENGLITFTGDGETFTAVYWEAEDTLYVRRAGVTLQYRRASLKAEGTWTMTEIFWDDGRHASAEEAGVESTLTFQDGTMTNTWDVNGNAAQMKYRYLVEGNSVLLRANSIDVNDPEITYDPETDTLRLFTSDDGRTCVFVRTPDVVIPTPEPEKTDDNIVTSDEDLAALRAKYPEYFGLDTESGLKVFVAEFACDSFSCTLLSGKDKDKTLLDISTMPGMTVGEMLSVLLTYDIPSEKIEVIPYTNPLSSYAYNIDALYTSYVTWKIKGGLPYLDAVQFDLDGDGREELCTLTYGPTSGLFTVVFSAYRDGKVIAQNVYNLHYGELYFEKTADGLRLSHTYSQWADSAPQTDIWLVSLKGGRIVWTNEKTGEEFSGYWGDESWNLDGKEPASDDMSEVNVSRTYLCVGATAGDRIVPTPWGYLSELNGLEAVENDPENATGDFAWVTRTYHTSVPDGQPKLAWGELRCGEEETPAAALRLETDLTDGGEPVVVHFALCDQPMEYGFLDEGIADAGPLVPEPTAATLFYADWDEDGVYEYLAYLKLPEIGKCLISDGERTLVLSDCVSVRGFYSDLDSKSPYGNLILSTEAADGSERVYELHPEGDAIVIGKTLNGYCFVDDGTLTEDEPYDLCIGEPSPFGSAYGYYTVHGDALTQWANSWEHERLALEFDGIDIQRDRDRLIKEGLLLKLKRDLPCTLNGKEGLLEAGTYVYLWSYLDTLTEAHLCTEDGRGVKVTMNGDADDLRIDGIPVSDYFDNAPRG